MRSCATCAPPVRLATRRYAHAMHACTWVPPIWSVGVTAHLTAHLRINSQRAPTRFPSRRIRREDRLKTDARLGRNGVLRIMDAPLMRTTRPTRLREYRADEYAFPRHDEDATVMRALHGGKAPPPCHCNGEARSWSKTESGEAAIWRFDSSGSSAGMGANKLLLSYVLAASGKHT